MHDRAGRGLPVGTGGVSPFKGPFTDKGIRGCPFGFPVLFAVEMTVKMLSLVRPQKITAGVGVRSAIEMLFDDRAVKAVPIVFAHPMVREIPMLVKALQLSGMPVAPMGICGKRLVPLQMIVPLVPHGVVGIGAVGFVPGTIVAVDVSNIGAPPICTRAADHGEGKADQTKADNRDPVFHDDLLRFGGFEM